MIPAMISLYLAVPVFYDDEGERDYNYDKQREKAIQQLNEHVKEEKRENDSIGFEENYFYARGKNSGKGKSGGKKGGRSTKSKFSEQNLITFHLRNDQEKKRRSAKRTLIAEREYLRETTGR